MRTTRQEKNQYPKIYGYGSVEQLQSDAENNLSHWISFRYGDGDLRFVTCTKEYFHSHRNETRNEERRNQSYAKHCPVSTDSLLENYEFEFADPSYQENLEIQKTLDTADYIWNLLAEFNDMDQLILKLHIEGHTDASIAGIVDKARSTVQEKRVKLVKLLQDKMKKIK